ncbi:hypothetical protein F4779DRAFT_627176 [Xylariaceae sp. FL0662B]|nr:hypothetical protein F4779DRAFT_627176 [Xylariaceae sp. FL0662B]
MNESTYNNVIRSNSPFSPMSPSTPNAKSYKTNVNRTKTRKWVEAKMQSYDGDDWGNDFEDEEEEEEEEPEQAPPKATGLRQPGQSNYHSISQPAPRTFSQPAAAVPQLPSQSALRNHSGPPSLHIQTQQTAPVAEPPSRVPPGRNSIIPQNVSNSGDFSTPRSGSRAESSSATRPSVEQPRSSSAAEQVVGSPAKPLPFARPSDIYSRIGDERGKERFMESGRSSMDSTHSRRDGASSPANAMRSPPDQWQRTRFGNQDNSDASSGAKPSVASVAERKSGYGIEGQIANARASESVPDDNRIDPRPLSTSPKLPDLTRFSGFGEDFLSSSVRFSTQAGRPGADGARLSLLAKQDDKERDTSKPSPEKQLPSMLDGPKLEPNPDIKLPHSHSGAKTTEESVAASRQDTSSRPQLPGTWVSETATAGSEKITPLEKAEGLRLMSRGSDTTAKLSLVGEDGAEPADIEPTTTVKQLPSQTRESETVAKTGAAHEHGDDAFDGTPGEHDNAVASKVVAAGPGYHPTPRSLPPLKTDNPPTASNKLRNEEPNDMAPPQSTSRGSPVQSSASTQPSTTTTGSGVPPTAPLNPRRSVAAPVEIPTPTEQQRYTMSTITTASPEKESDKLREEIMKSLSSSSSPANTPEAGGVLDQTHGGTDPLPGALTRESTYLSGVYDDYLTPAEEKSLQETGQYLKQGFMVSTQETGQSLAKSGSSHEKETVTPDIAPLASRKSPEPEPEPANRPRRFSWEQGPEEVTLSPVEPNPASFTLPFSSDPRSQGNKDAVPIEQSDAPAPASNALQAHLESPATISHQVSQVSMRGPGDASPNVLEPPSPISQTADKRASQLSFAEEKEQVLIHTSSNTSDEQHPALSRPTESIVLSPPAQVTPQARVISFRDILSIDSTEERIKKFDETRAQFYAMESGLSNWILHMKSQPEHGGVPIPTGGQPGGTLAQGQHSPTSAHPPTQQPYYQQYLNASSPNAPAGQPGRTSTGNLQMFSGQPTSGFGSSGNQVGTKGKEFLHAAGAFGNKGMKSGMKLFNKGKNKLRGTGGGDKAFF